MEAKPGLQGIYKDLMTRHFLQANGLDVAYAYTRADKLVTVVAPLNMFENPKSPDDVTRHTFQFVSGQKVNALDFPVSYGHDTYDGSVIIVINPSISDLSRQQRPVAILYALGAAASSFNVSNSKIVTNLDFTRRIYPEVAQFVAEWSAQQSMMTDLVRAIVEKK